jgi:hypothetical protein
MSKIRRKKRKLILLLLKFFFHKKSDNYEVTGSDTLAVKRGNLLRLSTSNTKNGWSTVKSTGAGRSAPTEVSIIPIAVEE